MEERELEMKETIASKDKELIEILRQEQEKQAEYFKRGDMEIQDLKISMKRMHEEKIQRLEAAQPLYALTWPSSLGSGRRQPEQTPAKSRPTGAFLLLAPPYHKTVTSPPSSPGR
jgi:hypothetical protein